MSNKPDSAVPSLGETLATLTVLALLAAILIATCNSRPQIAYESVAPALTAIDKAATLLKSQQQEFSTLELQQTLGELQTLLTPPSASTLKLQSRNQATSLINKALEQTDTIEKQQSTKNLKSALILEELETRLGELRAELQSVSTPPPILSKEIWAALPGLVWPLLIGLFLLYLFWSERAPQRLAQLFSQFKSIKLPGFELLTHSEAWEGIHRAFREYREQAKKEFDKRAESLGLAGQLKSVVDGVCNHLELPPAIRSELRATIHVEDILFEHTLYQLLDYYPRGDGAGRAFTVRFGIIGKAWRSDEAQIQEQVPTDPKQLVLEWGMTQGEAKGKGLGKQSFACVILWDKPNGRKVGLLYMDANQKNAFGGRANEMEALITRKCMEEGLIESLIKLREQVYRTAPMLKVHE